MKVLITDDSKMARISSKRVVLGLFPDAEIIIAKNGQEAIDKYKEEGHFDFVLMDLTMPEKTGYEATDEIKKFDENAKIIIVTADVQNSAIQKGLELGAIAVIEKPIDAELLKTFVENF